MHSCDRISLRGSEKMELFMTDMLSMVGISRPLRCEEMTFPLEMPNWLFQRHLLLLLQRQASVSGF